jgi:hypothetical protein
MTRIIFENRRIILENSPIILENSPIILINSPCLFPRPFAQFAAKSGFNEEPRRKQRGRPAYPIIKRLFKTHACPRGQTRRGSYNKNLLIFYAPFIHKISVPPVKYYHTRGRVNFMLGGMRMKHTKKIFVAMTSVVFCAGVLQARGTRRHGWDKERRLWRGQSAEAVSVSGKLQLVNGRVAVAQDNKTYYIMGINHLVGFVDGLKEGAAVVLEGNARALPYSVGSFMLMVTKLSLNGKEYENPLGYPFP